MKDLPIEVTCEECGKTVKGERQCYEEFETDFDGWCGSTHFLDHKPKYCNM